MRIAICLFGKVGGMSRDGLYADLDLPTLHQNLKENVMHGDHHFDVFIHSWSEHRKDDIIDLYEPKCYTIEKERFIPPPDYARHVKVWEDCWNATPKHDARRDIIHKAHTELWSIEIFNSRWYSQCRAVKLMDWYSKKTGTKYDAVFLSRFDCGWTTKFDWDDVIISPKSMWVLEGQFQDNLLQVGEIVDFWFASTQKNITEFGKAWDWIQQTECFDFARGPLCKEHFNAMTSHNMAYHIIAIVMGMQIWTKYVQHEDCDLARANDKFWQTTDLGKIE